MFFKIWFISLRPKTLFAAFCPVMLGSTLAFIHGVFDGGVTTIILACALLIQIGTNFANDYYDFKKGADTDTRQGPKRAIQNGWISLRQMRIALALVLGMAAVLGGILVLKGGLPILIIGVMALLCAIGYTGGPFPLGYMGLGDVFAWLFFGPVAVAGTYYLQANSWSNESVIAGAILGLFSIALIEVNNIRDVDQDRLVGKKTMPVRWGATFGKWVYTMSILGAIAGPGLAFGRATPWVWLPLILLPFVGYLITQVWTKTGAELNPILGKTGLILFMGTLLWIVGLVV